MKRRIDWSDEPQQLYVDSSPKKRQRKEKYKNSAGKKFNSDKKVKDTYKRSSDCIFEAQSVSSCKSLTTTQSSLFSSPLRIALS